VSLVDKIKHSAKASGAKIQTSEELALEKILNEMFYLQKKPEEEAEFVKQVMTRGLETQERIGLHASALIAGERDFCVRAQVLSLVYHQLQGEQLPARSKRIFEEGNAVHEKWQRLFIRAGYSRVDQLDVTQYNEEYMINYTPDVICEIPKFYDGQMIGEIKSVNTIQFNKMACHPSAGKQLQWYMFLTGIRKGFVLNDNKNTQEVKIEVYDYDPVKVAPFIDRAEEVKYYHSKLIHEGKLVRRPPDALSSECKRCAKCAMRLSCWNLPGGKQRLRSTRPKSKGKQS
jgi:hypothetical protein